MPESRLEHWDSFWEKKSLLPLQKVIEELENVLDLKGKSILEIGAGSGTTAIALAEKGAKVTCLDFSKKSLNLIIENKSKSPASDTISLVNGNAFNLPFEDNSFDVCYHQGFLEHFHDIAPLMLEQARILKKGGILLIDVPQRYNYYTIKKRILIAQDKWFAGWETEFSCKELKDVYTKYNFEIMQTFGRYHFRHLDRIQKKILGKEYLPKSIERAFYTIVKYIENTWIGCNTAFAVGVVGKKR